MHKRYLRVYSGTVQSLREYIDYQEGLLRRVEDDISRDLYLRSTPFRPTTLWTGPAAGGKETLRVAQLRIQQQVDGHLRAGIEHGLWGTSPAAAQASPLAQTHQTRSHEKRQDGEFVQSRDQSHRHTHRRKHASGHKNVHGRDSTIYSDNWGGGTEEDKEPEDLSADYRRQKKSGSFGQISPSQMPTTPEFSSASRSNYRLSSQKNNASVTSENIHRDNASGQLQLSLHSPVKINDFSVHLNLDLPVESSNEFDGKDAHLSHQLGKTRKGEEMSFRKLEDGPLQHRRGLEAGRSPAYYEGYGYDRPNI